MKPLVLSIVFLAFLQTSFAQNYEYDINGRIFNDSISENSKYDMSEYDIIVIRKDGIEYAFERVASNERRKPNFENTDLDSNYIYHKVAEGENTEYLLELYQICAPCFAKWNNFELEYREFPIVGETRKLKTIRDVAKEIMFEYLKSFELYEGEYLKVALKKNYQNGMSATYKTRFIYVNFERRTYVNDEILRKYNINREQFLEWNIFLEKRVHYVQNITLIIGKIDYKYACPCLEN